MSWQKICLCFCQVESFEDTSKRSLGKTLVVSHSLFEPPIKHIKLFHTAYNIRKIQDKL